jgi:hypothetical protein
MPDTSVRFRHRFEPWRQQLSAWIALPRDAQKRDRSELARAHRLGDLAQVQDVVSGASSFADAREGILRLRNRLRRTAPSSAELSVAAAARTRALDAVVTQIDALPASAVSGPPDPTPPRAG